MAVFDFCSKICERDMDYLIMLLCEESRDFLNLLLKPKGWEGAELYKIYHSLTDVNYGESDITVIVEKDGNKYAVLIEDKIDAIAMPEQSSRYLKRAKAAMKQNDYQDFILYIAAPEHYLANNDEAKKYPNQIPYETIQRFVFEHDIPCRDFASGLLQAALNREKNGYQVVEVPDVTNFWSCMADYMKTQNIGIPLHNPKLTSTARGANANWFRFECDLAGTALYYKSNKGFADLQFNGQAKNEIELKERLLPHISPKMKWVITGQSVCLRMNVPSIDVKKPFSEAEKYLPKVFEAVGQLHALALDMNQGKK